MPKRGELVLAAGRTWLRTPFHWEASLKGVGADCKGLLGGAARECGFPEGNTMEAVLVGYARHIDEAKLLAGLDRLFDRVPCDLGQAEPGDVLAFRIRDRVQHLGLYGGDGTRHTVLHAYSGNPSMVLEMPLERMWTKRLAGVWRWRELGGGD